jgi:hypothetical protein
LREKLFGIISGKALARSRLGPYSSHPSLIDACETQVAQEQIGLGTGIEFDVEKTKRTLKKVRGKG